MERQSHNRRGLLIILSSPSGAGKSFHSKILRKWDPSIQFSVSATTRPPRVGEEDGVDYHFVEKQEFKDMVAEGEMLEHAEVFTNLYGSPKAPVKTAMGAGEDTLFDIDWQGGQQIRNSSLGNDVVSIFLLPPSMKVLEERLRSRGQDSDEVIEGRMAKSLDEVSHWAEYDYVLVNDDPDECAESLKAILTAERARRERQISLNDFVRELQTEYEDQV
ncbi:MAG TPA: guanylate kinase [Octadecabacter sp.]|nr:guanylate kinase [Octadecabacter sp.]